MDNDRIINKLIALEAMALTLVENCRELRKEIAPSEKKKRKKSGLSDEDILRMEQHVNAVLLRRNKRIEEAERDCAKQSN
jgi:hypothetical protein